jgi:hypothetical protein
MNQEFIPYEQALEFKELGFNESCFFIYSRDGNALNRSDEPQNSQELYERTIQPNTYVVAPLYQQAFKWFREKYFLDAEIYLNHELGHKFYHYLILQLVRENIEWKSRNITKFKTYEEAELACLKKLIELVKTK